MSNEFSADHDDDIFISSSSFGSSLLKSDLRIQAELLRREARRVQLEAREVSKQSQWEYHLGSKFEAKRLSIKKNALYHEMNEKRRQAAALIFEQHNRYHPANVIDLHGLYVEEALRALQWKVDDCRSMYISRLKVITGVGNHSSDKIAKIKPNMENFALENYLKMTVHDAYVLFDLTVPDRYQGNNQCSIQ